MRLFVAAEPSTAVRESAFARGTELRAHLESVAAGDGLRWIPVEYLHLTVWFLGEVSEPRAAAVLEALATPVAVAPFDLHLAGLGAFPPSGPPRVIWMGVQSGVDQLARAHDEVGERLAPWGFPREARAYSAHLTLARVKVPPHGRARKALREVLTTRHADAGRCRVDALTVFRSRTAPSGAVYERLLRVPLR